jgi:hypothetical protein
MEALLMPAINSAAGLRGNQGNNRVQRITLLALGASEC